MSRLFFALWPDSDIRNKLAAVGEGLPENRGKLVPKQNLHITLSFLGNIDKGLINPLLSGAAKIRARPFSLNLDQIGWWKRPKVIWVAPTDTPEALNSLVHQVNARVYACGLSSDARSNQPHLTLVRKAMKPVRGMEFDPIHWNIRDFCLIESITHATGAEYKVLESWALSSR